MGRPEAEEGQQPAQITPRKPCVTEPAELQQQPPGEHHIERSHRHGEEDIVEGHAPYRHEGHHQHGRHGRKGDVVCEGALGGARLRHIEHIEPAAQVHELALALVPPEAFELLSALQLEGLHRRPVVAVGRRAAHLERAVEVAVGEVDEVGVCALLPQSAPRKGSEDQQREGEDGHSNSP